MKNWHFLLLMHPPAVSFFGSHKNHLSKWSVRPFLGKGEGSEAGMTSWENETCYVWIWKVSELFLRVTSKPERDKGWSSVDGWWETGVAVDRRWSGDSRHPLTSLPSLFSLDWSEDSPDRRREGKGCSSCGFIFSDYLCCGWQQKDPKKIDWMKRGNPSQSLLCSSLLLSLSPSVHLSPRNMSLKGFVIQSMMTTTQCLRLPKK